MVERRTLGQDNSLSPSPAHPSHTRNITLSRIKCKRYIFIKKCVSAYICIMSIQHKGFAFHKGWRERKGNKTKKTKNQQSNTKDKQSVTGTQLLAELSYGRHCIQPSFEFFTNDTVFAINLYTSGAKVFPPNPYYALLL